MLNFPLESFYPSGFGSPYEEVLSSKEIAFTMILMCSDFLGGRKSGCVKDAMLTLQKVVI